MTYKLLFIFIEGNDDERFFEKIIVPKLKEKYNALQILKYAKVKNKKIDSFLKSVKAMGAEYIYATDINLAPCVTAKKQETLNKLKNIDDDRIIVVIKEIESWYLAGLDGENSRKLGISPCNNTNNYTKEQFNGLIPIKFDSRTDFMQEILKYFQVEIAKQKNRSFRYFFGKHDC